MHKLYWSAFLLFSCIICNLIPSPVSAVSENIVISQVQIGNVSSSRLVEIYNNSDEPVDITDWCVYHSSASGKTINKLVCFDVPDISYHLILKARSYALIGSSQLGLESDFDTNLGLGSITGGHVYLKDKTGNEIDRVGWGTAELAEGLSPVPINPDNLDFVLERKQNELNEYIDTDVNSSDFINSSLRVEYIIGSIDEVIDVCKNLDEIQVLVPDDYYLDISGDCLPEQVDICPNLDGIQLNLPEGFFIFDGDCVPNLLPLKITELLPDAIGSDEGGEFIEIYNPNNVSVDLSLYKLSIGLDVSKIYSFPIGSVIEANSYKVFYNNSVLFTLVNSSSSVNIMGSDGTIIDSSEIYINPKEGETWALIDDLWQYTNQSTPGAENKAMLLIEIESRNVTTSSKLVPCKDGQYRSEETNRCRNIVTDVANNIPCEEGKERNPETNRCRLIVTATESSLKACPEGQERNSETNRCRNIISSMPEVGYKPEQIDEKTDNSALYISLAVVGIIAIIYGVWEWRVEIIRIFRKR